MEVSLLTEGQATCTVARLVRECIRFDVAVAWPGANVVVDAMLAAHPKLGKVVIGTHMHQADPTVLRAFMPFKGARCLPPDGRLFHPKVYPFETPAGFSAVVGSHNLTGGAFGGRNIEVSVLLEGAASDEVPSGLASFVLLHWAGTNAKRLLAARQGPASSGDGQLASPTRHKIVKGGGA